MLLRQSGQHQHGHAGYMNEKEQRRRMVFEDRLGRRL